MRVSVLIPTHNYARFVADAVHSALSQDYEGPQELIVVDDGSVDETPQVLGRYARQLRYVRQDNSGQAAALNTAYTHATGDVICFLDADDTWHSDKVRRVVEAFWEDGALGLVHHALDTVDVDGDPLDSDLLTRWTLADGDVRRLMRKTVLEWCFMPTSAISVTREVARKVFPLPVTLKSSADEFIAPLAALLAPVRYLDQSLGSYRYHGANVWAAGAFSEAADEAEKRRAASRYLKLIEEKVTHANDVLARVGSQERLTPWTLWWYLRCKAVAGGRRPVCYLWPGLRAVATDRYLPTGEKIQRMATLVRKAVWKSMKPLRFDSLGQK